MVVEGEISGLCRKAHLIDFRLGGRDICVERTAASSRLRNGERIRVALQAPVEDPFFHVLAFQRTTDPAMRRVGPQAGPGMTFLACALLAVGIYTGIGVLLIPATSFLLFTLLLAADLRNF
jgi:hypothetical protein